MILLIIWASIARTLSGFQGSLVMRFSALRTSVYKALGLQGIYT